MTDFNLPENLDIDNHEHLPGLVKFGIRQKFIVTPQQEELRRVARLVGQAQAAALPTSDLLVVLAGAVIKDRADGFAPDWHPFYRAIHDLAWSMWSSPNGLKNTLLAPLGRDVTLEDHAKVVQRFIEEEQQKRAMTPAEANKIIRDTMNELAPIYPELGMSFGYIGNIWHGPYRDDRSYRVFTKLRDRFGYSVKFGEHSVDRLGDLAFLVRAKLADWCAEQRALLQQGKVHSLIPAAA